MRNIQRCIGFTVGCTLGFAVVGLLDVDGVTKRPSNKEIPISFPVSGATLRAEIADTAHARQKGLSGRKQLGRDRGILFVFKEEGYHQFWMKQMSFPIDIIWLDKEKRIVDIAKQVEPDTFPHTFKPGSAALYVLEVNAGFSEKHEVSIGDSMKW
ncbi:MAG: DUF192 domain-containing protein [bacterium]|nr:DUF192 domain-containing protein [bacterium]